MVDIVYSPRHDGRDDETNDYTLAEDQGRYFGGCFEIFAILLETFPKTSTLICSHLAHRPWHCILNLKQYSLISDSDLIMLTFLIIAWSTV